MGKKMRFSKNDTGPFGVYSEVFLARFEAFPSCFDLRGVVWFTYAHTVALQTMHALQKEASGVKQCFTKKSQTHPLQLGLDTQS